MVSGDFYLSVPAVSFHKDAWPTNGPCFTLNYVAYEGCGLPTDLGLRAGHAHVEF
jgi:hypothetical protein